MITIHALESNCDNVALNLVYAAIVDAVDKPGHAIAELLERMAKMAREIGEANRAAATDFLGSGIEPSELETMMQRQVLTAGETWALNWMLAHMSKHLCEELEMRCENDPYAAHIESIEYETDGSVKRWSERKV
jgi:hypothetical protein